MNTIKQVGIIGAGIMGTGIAQICAMKAYQVTLLDLSQSALEQSLVSIERNIDRMVQKDQLTTEKKQEAMKRIQTSSDYSVFKSADLVIEAASEQLKTKASILEKLEPYVKEDTLLASNTSSLSITLLASFLKKPARFVGMHFFNPAPIMALVEIIAGLQSAAQTVESIKEFSKLLGKTPIIIRNGPGFVVNRLICLMINEAIIALHEGVATASDIDQGMTLGCAHPMGPLALADLIGLDTLLSILKVMHTETGDPKYRPALLLSEMVAAGYLGRKSQRGFFDYPAKN